MKESKAMDDHTVVANAVEQSQGNVAHDINAAEAGTSLEKALQQLWEKTRSAAEVIAALRSEKKALEEKVRELEISVTQAQSDILSKDVELAELRASVEKFRTDKSPNGSLSTNEGTDLQEKIRFLIEKINAYL